MITAKEIIEYRAFLRQQVLGEFISKGYGYKVDRHNIYVYIRGNKFNKVEFSYKKKNLWISGGETYIDFEEVNECVEMFKRAIDKVSDEDLEVLSL